jgi:hypothetical protein
LEVVSQPGQAARPLDDLDRVQSGMMAHHRLGRVFHEIGDVSGRKPAAQGADRGRGEHHIADQAQPDQEDLQGSTVASSISITGMSSLMG